MRPDLAAYFARQTLVGEDVVRWANGSLPLRVTGYLTGELPPLDLVTSVRALVFRDDRVLVQQDRDAIHILPGGRREPGETLDATLRREVLEETGWAISGPLLLGCLHFRHLADRPAGYRYLYPDFLQLVYVAEAVCWQPDAQLDDGHELGSAFRPLPDVCELSPSSGERRFLDAALRLKGAPLGGRP